MGCIWNIVRPHLQGGRENSDANALATVALAQKFSSLESSENFIW
jgi:hypothetical protein